MKRKGFTLVELLIVIVILGIITGISIPLIRNIREKNQNKEYSNYIESLEYSAKLYMDSHKEDLFILDGDEGCAIIEYDELEKKGLLKDIGINNVSCNNRNTFVAVEKKGNEYTYKINLQCTSDEETVYTKEGINREDCKENSVAPTVKLVSQNNIAPTQIGILTITDEDDGIVGYYFGKSNPKQTTVSYTEVAGRPHELVINDVEITEAGTYYLVAKDAAGNRSQVLSKSVYQITLNPNGGSIEPSKILTLEGDSIFLPTPTKEGYVFEGWYEDESLTNHVDGSYSPTGNKNLYAKWDIEGYTYSIRYIMNGGTLGDGSPTSANYKEIIALNAPQKTFTVNFDPNSQGASITNEEGTITNIQLNQAFSGWRGTNLSPIAQYGIARENLVSWNGESLIGQEAIYIKNLGNANEEVVLTANWSASSITLPKLKKVGYSCSYNTKADGSGDSYESEGIYIPSITDGSETLYVRCTTIDMLMVHDDTESKTFGYNIARSQFTSITIVDHLNIPSGATSWDVSAKKNRSVMAWYTGSSGNRALYIGQVGGVIANIDSSKAFSEFKKVKTINVSKLNVSHVTSMYRMFYDAGYSATTFTITGLNSFDTSSVTTMASMFGSSGYSATTYSIGNLSNWNTSNVEDMGSMFNKAGYSATTFNIGNLNNWDTSKVWDLGGMFNESGYSATTWNVGDLSNWNTKSSTNMEYMFHKAGRTTTSWEVGNLSNWNTSKVTSMQYMFSEACYSDKTCDIGYISNWDTSNVTTMASIFLRAAFNSTVFNINLSNWDTSKVTSLHYAFSESGYNSTTWSIGDISSWDVSNVTNMTGIFSEAGYKATSFQIDVSTWNTSKVTSLSGAFNKSGYSATTWSIGNLSSWNTSKATDMSYMFSGAGHSATTWSSIGTLKVYAKNIYSFFYSVPKINAKINFYSNPTNYTSAFQSAATKSGSRIDLYYSRSTSNINSIYNTKSSGAYIYKSGYLD